MNSTLTPMDAQRKTAIRQLLVEQAHASTAHRPGADSRQFPRRPLLLVGTAAAAVGLGAVTLVAVDPTSPPSYASWTAVPETAAGTAIVDDEHKLWASQCSELGVGGVTVEGVPRRIEQASKRSPLVDRRGDFTFCVDITPGSGTASDPLIALSGIRADDGPLEELNTMSATVHDEPFSPPVANEVVVLTGSSEALPPAEAGIKEIRAYQFAGLVGPDVRGVDIVLANGLRITATVDNGMWGMWWPADKGTPEGGELHLETTSGSRVVGMDEAWLRLMSDSVPADG